MKLSYLTKKLSLLASAPSSDSPNSTSAMTVRARGPGDQRGISVWPKVSVDSAPQYRFMAFAAATPTEKTISTNGAMPCVNHASPATKLPLGAARPTIAPSTMGKNEPKVQPQ